MVLRQKIKYAYRGKFDPAKLAPDNIDRLSTGLVKPKTKILELGCAAGFMSEYFRKQLSCKVIGVDINREAKPDITGDLNEPTTWQEIRRRAPYDLVFASAI
ncbi:hypothetical protein COW80_02130, partial [Candidatus Beckwithbacteria bacterium CG22_combo_CG10-13_8_21_14_all_01_47_9]